MDEMRGKAKNYSAQKRESLSEKLGRRRIHEFVPRPHFGSPSFLFREMIFLGQLGSNCTSARRDGLRVARFIVRD